MAWGLARGLVGDGQRVWTTCGRRDCVAPGHLSVLAPAQRRPRKAKAAPKLDAERVVLVRERLAAGVPQREIAAAVGVSESMISLVKNGHAWAGVELRARGKGAG